MRLSTKTEYGLRALVHLAENAENRPYSLQKIAELEALPYHFLEKIMQSLKSGGVVSSQRGLTGGYHLAKPAEEITVRHVIEILEGDTCVFSGIASNDQSPAIHCKSHIILAALENKIQDSLNNVRLADLITKRLSI